MKWIYHIKIDANGNPTNYKVRLVAKRLFKEYGIDYFETFEVIGNVQVMLYFINKILI